MSTIYQPPPTLAAMSTSTPGTCLKVSTIIFGTLGMIWWGLSIGFMLGWDNYSDYCLYGGGIDKVRIGWYVSVPTNAAMVYVTARIIFVITSRSFPSPVLLADLHECVARLVAFTVLSLTMWCASISWLVKDACEVNLVYHLCNYGFLDSALVAGLAGGLWTVTSRTAAAPQMIAAAPNYRAPAQPPPPPQTHYNHAYVHQYR